MKAIYSSSRRRRAPTKAAEIVRPTIWDKPLWEDRACARRRFRTPKISYTIPVARRRFPITATRRIARMNASTRFPKNISATNIEPTTRSRSSNASRPGCGNTFPDRMGGPCTEVSRSQPGKDQCATPCSTRKMTAPFFDYQINRNPFGANTCPATITATGMSLYRHA
jgi:hypothetical protein